MGKKLNYHKSLDFYHRRNFPSMLTKLTKKFRAQVNQVKIAKCADIITPLVYNLTEWLLSHLYGKGMLYALNFEEEVLPILKKYCEDTSVTSRTFGNKFYHHAERVATHIRDRKKSVPTLASTPIKVLKPKINHALITSAVSKIPMSRICFLAKQVKNASENRFLTTFCARLLGELGVTDQKVEETFVYSTQQGDRYLLRRKIIKAVLIQLRLRICDEAQRVNLLKIGERVPFCSRPKTLLKIGQTGMLIVPQDEERPERTTHLDPIYYPLVIAIESGAENRS